MQELELRGARARGVRRRRRAIYSCLLALRYCAAVTDVGLRMRRKNMNAVASERANL